MIYLELFATFFIIGMFTIGGGYAMLSLIQNEVVTVHGWIDETTFTRLPSSSILSLLPDVSVTVSIKRSSIMLGSVYS